MMRPQEKGKRNTNSIGDASESAITTRFIQLGYIVLTPFGGNQRYDLVIENAEGDLHRVQCKTARMRTTPLSFVIHQSKTSLEIIGNLGIIGANVISSPLIAKNSIKSISFL